MLFEIITGLLISYIILFSLSILLKDNSIADIFWGIGFLQITIHSLILSNAITTPQIIISSLIGLWSLRLASHTLTRKLKTKKEDPRYATWRNTWKYFYIRSFFQVYILQGLLMLIIAIPIMITNISNNISITYTIISAIIALFGLTYETIADKQLKNFISNKNNKGKIMQKGLWKYSRHPNYFGESIFWMGITGIGITANPISILSFLTITFLLRYVSGVPMAEINMKKKEEFKEYSKKTPAMFPNFFIK